MGINLRKDIRARTDKPDHLENSLKLVKIGLVKDQEFLRPGQVVVNKTNFEYCRYTVLWVTVTTRGNYIGNIPYWTLTDSTGKIRVYGTLGREGICNSAQKDPHLGLHCKYFEYWHKQEVLNWTVYEQKKTLEEKRRNST